MSNARNAKSTREKAAQLRAEADRAAARKRVIAVGVAVLVVIGIAVGLVVLVKSAQQDQANRDAAAVAPPANLYNGTSPVGGGLLVGNGSAKVTVDVYEDFLCPICNQFEQADGPILQKYADAGKIALVHHPVAILDRSSQGTRYSTRSVNAWAAVLNASGPKVTAAYTAALFANQPEENTPGLTDDTLLDLAEKAGANRAAIEQDVRGLRFGGWVSQRTEKFTMAFTGTPTVTINGVMQKDLSPDKLTAAIDAALAK